MFRPCKYCITNIVCTENCELIDIAKNKVNILYTITILGVYCLCFISWVFFNIQILTSYNISVLIIVNIILNIISLFLIIITDIFVINTLVWFKDRPDYLIFSIVKSEFGVSFSVSCVIIFPVVFIYMISIEYLLYNIKNMILVKYDRGVI